MSCVTVEIKPKEHNLNWWTPQSQTIGQIVMDKYLTWCVSPPPRVNPDPSRLVSILVKVNRKFSQHPVFGCQFIPFPTLTDKGWDLSEMCLVVDSKHKREYFTWADVICGRDSFLCSIKVVSTKRMLLQGIHLHEKLTSTFNPPDAWNWMYHGPVASFGYLEKNGFDVPVVESSSPYRRLIQEVLYTGPLNKTERALLQFHLVLTLQKEAWPVGSRCDKLKRELLEMGEPKVYNETLLVMVDRFGEIVTYGEGEAGGVARGEIFEDTVSPEERLLISWYAVPFTILK